MKIVFYVGVGLSSFILSVLGGQVAAAYWDLVEGMATGIGIVFGVLLLLDVVFCVNSIVLIRGLAHSQQEVSREQMLWILLPWIAAFVLVIGGFLGVWIS